MIKKVEAQVDDLTAELSKTSQKLKNTLKKFRKGSNVIVDIAMIVI